MKRTLTNEEIVRMYESGERTVVIAEKANVSARYIRNILQSENVEMRKRGSWRRKYEVNEDYFKTWSRNMAYILGFFAADGTVSNQLQSISFSQKEKGILIRIKEELGSDHKIIENNAGVHSLVVFSKIMKSDPKEIHGFTNNKSRSIKMPKVPREYQSDFFRGYFDGDGCIYADKRFVNIVGGSLDFLRSISEMLQTHGIQSVIKTFDSYYRIYISGNEAERLFYWMYDEKELYLERKFVRFENVIKKFEKKNKG
ncbi:hypothetical protein LCM20_00170 [Halobacillus litoralis]|uniref:LAGLIDADG family homing endonuclease n=1 Tax=Halobacillus litoralis TaxID=45668 RepID=UPI001CD5FC0B|nr:LAGLIDADG family homing endonuclease [Halobacillus litoralis]MCA0968998.1 hypothetical protein [Halobacillus litoralis]